MLNFDSVILLLLHHVRPFWTSSNHYNKDFSLAPIKHILFHLSRSNSTLFSQKYLTNPDHVHTLIGENLCRCLENDRMKGGKVMQPRMRSPFPPPGNPPRGSMMPRGGPSMNRAGFRPPRPQRGGGGGGLLAKLLGNRGNQRGASNPFSFPTSSAAGQATSRGGGGGLLKTLTDPNALNGFLANTEKMLSTAQQIGPMVQQYGPMVKNLPSLWKLYKGFRDLPSESEEDSPKEEVQKKKTQSKKKKAAPTGENEKASQRKNSSKKGASAPKLYI